MDALLGEATREHAGLDLVVLRPQLAVVRSLLTEAGYATVLRDLLPASAVWTTYPAGDLTPAFFPAQGREPCVQPCQPRPLH